MTQDNKCAPNKIYKDGTCFSLDDLKIISSSYNKSNPNDTISIDDDKKNMLKQLTSKLSNKCNDQICWLRQDFIKKSNNKELINNTFRPDGPEGKFEWLSTRHINNVMSQYENKYTDFKFFGAVPIDFDDIKFLGIKDLDLNDLKKNNKTKLGFVFNLDEHWKSGSHWVALYVDLLSYQSYFFDSYGKQPDVRIKKLIKRIAKHFCYSKDSCKYDVSESETGFMNSKSKNKLEKMFNIEYNKVRHQFKNSECGVYSLNFILRLLNGESFEYITSNITTDDDVNNCRDTYFKFSKDFKELK